MTSHQPQEIAHLIVGFFEKSLTTAETRQLFEWMDANEENRLLFLELRRINRYRHLTVEGVMERWPLLAAKLDGVHHENAGRSHSRLVWMVACAAVILVAVVGMWMWVDNATTTSHNVFVYTTNRSTATLRMTDGTVVNLAPHSTLTYSRNYDNNDRKVTLDGEAYFNVATNTKKPFCVQSGEQSVVATGTKFSVRSYARDKVFVTTLMEGRIVVTSPRLKRPVALKPRQQVCYDNRRKTLVMQQVKNMRAEVSWINNVYEFDGATLDDIFNRMEHVYNVNFVCSHPEELNTTYKVMFYQKEGLDDFLRIVHKMTGLTAQRHKDVVYFNRPKEMMTNKIMED